MRRLRPAIAALAVGALVPMAAAAEAATPAAGSATSTATIASVSAVGHDVVVGELSADTGTTSGILSQVTLKPLVVDGSAVVPAVTVKPDSSPVTVASASTPGALAAILSVTSPALQLEASSGTAGPASGVTTPNGLGSVSVLGMDVVVDGSVNVASLTSSAKAEARKTLTINQIALPSLADILAALGLDVSKLPMNVLDDLAVLPLNVSATAAAALDTAQATVDTAQTQLNAATATLNTATATLTSEQGELATLLNAFLAAVTSAAIPGVDTIALWEALPPATQALYPAVLAAEAAYDAQVTVVAAAQAAVDTAQAAVNTATAALLAAVSNFGAVLNAGPLADTPLVSVDAAEIGTLARVDTAKAASVTGTLTSVNALGLDVLDALTGNSTLDLVGEVDAVLAELTSVANEVMDALSSALAGATGLSVPAPVVELMKKTTSTSTDGAFGVANAGVSVLSITLPAATIPEALALDSIVNALPTALPVNISELASGAFEATGFALSVGTLSEAARFRPASLTSAPGGPDLPATGAPYGLAVLAGAVAAVAVIIRRRMAQAAA